MTSTSVHLLGTYAVTTREDGDDIYVHVIENDTRLTLSVRNPQVPYSCGVEPISLADQLMRVVADLRLYALSHAAQPPSEAPSDTPMALEDDLVGADIPF